MKYYRNPNTGEVFAYEEDGSQDDYISDELVRMTDAEVEAWLNPPPSEEQLAAIARAQRDQLLATVYDPGINMALRALRMATATADKNAAKAKVAELDEYAEALVAIPQQEGFPHSIVWPETPTKESSV